MLLQIIFRREYKSEMKGGGEGMKIYTIARWLSNVTRWHKTVLWAPV